MTKILALTTLSSILGIIAPVITTQRTERIILVQVIALLSAYVAARHSLLVNGLSVYLATWFVMCGMIQIFKAEKDFDSVFTALAIGVFISGLMTLALDLDITLSAAVITTFSISFIFRTRALKAAFLLSTSTTNTILIILITTGGYMIYREDLTTWFNGVMKI